MSRPHTQWAQFGGAVVLVFVVFVFFLSHPAGADDQLDDKQDELEKINAKIKAYNQIIDVKQRQGSTLAGQIATLEAQATKLEAELSATREKLGTLTGDIARLDYRVGEKERMMTTQKELLVELLRGRYFDQAIEKESLYILPAAEALDRFRGGEYRLLTSDRISTVLDQTEELKRTLELERSDLDQKRAAAATLAEQLDKRSDYLESAKDTKAVLLAKTQSDVRKYDTLVDQLEQEREEIENEIAELESGKIEALNLKDLPSFKKGLLKYPVKHPRLTQGYGKTSFAQKSSFYKNGFHNGYDFGVPTGTNILAAADGKVVALGNNGRYAYGRWLAVDHGNGITTMYGHLSSIKKSRGDKVEQGDTIATSGNTGNSTGPHLHFTIFATKTFEIVPSKTVKSVRDIPIGATVSPGKYLP